MSKLFSHRAALQCLCLNQMCSHGSIFLDYHVNVLGFSEGVLFTQSRCYVDLSLVRQGAECSQAAKATMVAGQSTLNAQSSCVDGSFHGLLFGDAQCHNDAGQWPGLLWNKKRGWWDHWCQGTYGCLELSVWTSYCTTDGMLRTCRRSDVKCLMLC